MGVIWLLCLVLQPQGPPQPPLLLSCHLWAAAAAAAPVVAAGAGVDESRWWGHVVSLEL